MVCRKFARIGLLPSPKVGMSDITQQYVAKYGVPAVAKKVFIRIQQMKDYLSSIVYTTSALLPGEVAWSSEAEGA
jgi:hypothetical protein